MCGGRAGQLLYRDLTASTLIRYVILQHSVRGGHHERVNIRGCITKRSDRRCTTRAISSGVARMPKQRSIGRRWHSSRHYEIAGVNVGHGISGLHINSVLFLSIKGHMKSKHPVR